MNIVETVLELENVTMQFGGVVAVDSFSMHVDQGETVALIGPNGAGKTTAFNVITGVYAPTNGCVKLRGKIIAQGHPTGKMRKLYAGTHIGEYNHLVSNTPDKITEMGVARTFQNIRLFKNMSVLENVLVARHMRLKAGLFASMLHVNQQEERRIRQESLDLLDMLGLGDVAQEKASSLPYGKQRYLEIARALATEPRLLLLDEPAAARLTTTGSRALSLGSASEAPNVTSAMGIGFASHLQSSPSHGHNRRNDGNAKRS